MFTDLISYCDNIKTLQAELTTVKAVDEDNQPVFPLHDKTPIQNRNPPKTMTLVRIRNADTESMNLLKSFKAIEILGTYDEVFADPAKYARYSAAYPHEPYTVKDEETGETITITPPKKFGVFA